MKSNKPTTTEVYMRKPGNITRYSPGLALAALTALTILALVHVAPAQAQVAIPNRTAATAQPALRANGKIAFVNFRYEFSSQYPFGQYSGISVMNPDGSGRTELTATQIL